MENKVTKFTATITVKGKIWGEVSSDKVSTYIENVLEIKTNMTFVDALEVSTTIESEDDGYEEVTS